MHLCFDFLFSWFEAEEYSTTATEMASMQLHQPVSYFKFFQLLCQWDHFMIKISIDYSTVGF